MNQSSQSRQKLYSLQALRGLAAVLVVLAHCDLIFNQNYGKDFWFKIFNFGGSGVDFFFVLSGFIILYIHQREIGNPAKVNTFLIKRFLRIYPIYWVFLGLKMLASFVFAYNPETTERSFLEIIKAITLFPQNRSILSTSFLGVSWTLSFEIMFYIIFALLIGVSSKIAYPIIAVWLLGVFGNFVGIIDLPRGNIILNFVFSEYNLEFALGCLAAYLFMQHKIKWAMPLILVGLFLYAFAAVNYYYQILPISPVIKFGIPSMLLVLGFASLERARNINVPGVLSYLGDASYSIYLAHGFAINNISKVVEKIYPDVTQNILILNSVGILIAVLSIIFGCLVHSLIEKQLMFSFKPKSANA
ncbi:acyltransferase [Nostoc sp. TCL26-01]|uniref:acyltransferase family protein n=1 Tax=Nostoc sp. TCL26-01 TaxID=2576904 RepID=UPI0015BE7566|nr:acyltransferase [Nostoc sp. TCL26-01]QLE56151.1 acyltransferase [Nostoc sp. TCL26-01]